MAPHESLLRELWLCAKQSRVVINRLEHSAKYLDFFEEVVVYFHLKSRNDSINTKKIEQTELSSLSIKYLVKVVFHYGKLCLQSQIDTFAIPKNTENILKRIF